MGRAILQTGIGLCLAATLAGPVGAQAVASAPGTQTMTVAQLFEFADAARDRGDFVSAETAYRALATNPDLELRTEARFRLAMMLADKLNRHREAAVEFRAILDEQPKAARVRLELARMQVLIGNLGAAEREFRAAQAGGLPPEVQQRVRFYAGALAARKPFGFSVEVAIAPDSNINRATRSDTLGTIIGDFTLDANAKAKSGVGLGLKGQGYFRTGIDQRASLLVQVSGKADVYRQSQFDDMIAALQVGPEVRSGKDRIALAGTLSLRWYGLDPFTRTWGVTGAWQHPLGPRAQLRAEAGVAAVDNRRNDLQDGTSHTASLAYDRAFSPRLGGGVQLSGSRDTARDPGYATTSGSLNGYLFREIGQTTLVGNLGYGHLEADARLFLYPRRRVEDRYSVGLAATFRALRLGVFAPLARVRFERNVSTIEIYDYRRLSGEMGITAAF